MLRTAGLLHQLVRAAGRDPAGALPELDRLIDEWCADYRDGCGARWIPVARQAEYQTRVVLSAFELAARHTRPCSSSGSGSGSNSGSGSGSAAAEPGWAAGAAVPMRRD